MQRTVHSSELHNKGFVVIPADKKRLMAGLFKLF